MSGRPPYAPKIACSYSIVDITKGRKKLAKHLREKGPIAVTITGYLTDPYGNDDGTSIEFNMLVDSIRPTP